MDGIEAIKYLKNNPVTADIPIIMCTGIMLSSDSLRIALDSGAVDYVRKPVDKIELQARVHSMLKLSDSYRTIKEQNIILEHQKIEIQQQATRLTKSYKNLEQLSKIGQEITSSLQIETIFASLYQYINQFMDATVLGIGKYIPEKQTIHYELAIEKGIKYKPYDRSTTDKNQFPVWCIENRKPIFINDISTEASKYIPDWKKDLNTELEDGSFTENPVSLLYFPLIMRDEVKGVISVQSYVKYAYQAHHLDILGTLAAYAVIAIENAENFKTIERQNVKIEKTHNHITDSIKYAKRIQSALLPYEDLLTNSFPNHFILYKPKDIVSGDFYWIRNYNQYVLIAAADCTGHGVPGAFMSMLGISILNEIITRRNANMPAQVLNELRAMLKKLLKQTGKAGESQDGMDIALCSYNTESKSLVYAGAHNPCWVFSSMNNEQLTIELMQLDYQ